MKKLLLFLFVYSTISVCAQDFQWSIRGGGKNNMASTSHYNNILAIEHDANDNVYIMGKTAAGFAEIDGVSLKTYSSYLSGATPDIIVASFTKNGDFRWSKIYGPETVGATGLKIVNNLVYVTGFNFPGFPSDTAYFDNDTAVYEPLVFQGPQRKSTFLIQYDTSGTFNWLRMPGSDSVSTTSISECPDIDYWMDTQANGEVYWLTWLKRGALRNTAVNTIAQDGIYVLHYSTNGDILNVIDLDMNHEDCERLRGQFNQGGFKRDPRTGEFYVGGTCYYNDQFNPKRSLTIGGDTVKGSMYLAKFSPTGQLVWLQQSDTTEFGSGINDFEIDVNSNIYITGTSKPGFTIFNGQTFTSSETSSGPYILKLDLNGNTIYGKIGANGGSNGSYQIILNGGEFTIVGDTGGLYFEGPNDNDTIKESERSGYDAYIARFDTATGDLIQLKAAKTKFGVASHGYSIGADSEGAYYIGGNYNGQLYLGNDTLFPLGSQRTFFLTKYACTPLQATFAVQADTLDGAFTFSGSANQAIDSIVWDFDNGHQLTGDSVGYQYFTVGTYIVCGTAYTGCGDSTFCDTLFVNKVGLEEKQKLAFSLAPNPAQENVQLHMAASGHPIDVKLYSINGQQLLQKRLPSGTTKAQLNISQLPAGVYLVVLQSGETGIIGRKKLIKE